MYTCSVFHYHTGHSELCVSLWNEQETFSYIWFIAVGYVESPTHWIGANFMTASRDECMRLMSKRMQQSAVEAYIDDCRLFFIDTLSTQVKILASAIAGRYTKLDGYQRKKDDSILARIIMNPYSGKPCIMKKLDTDTGKFNLMWEFAEGYGIAEIQLDMILEHLEQGYTQKEIMFRYSWVSGEDIQACLVYARRAISLKTD